MGLAMGKLTALGETYSSLLKVGKTTKMLLVLREKTSKINSPEALEEVAIIEDGEEGEVKVVEGGEGDEGSLKLTS